MVHNEIIVFAKELCLFDHSRDGSKILHVVEGRGSGKTEIENKNYQSKK